MSYLYYNRVLKSTQYIKQNFDKKISLFQGFEGIFLFIKCQTPVKKNFSCQGKTLDTSWVLRYNPEFDTYMTKKRLEPLMYKGSGVFRFSYFLSNAFRFLLALKIFFISCVGMICILVLKGNSACNASINSSYSYAGAKPSLLIL